MDPSHIIVIADSWCNRVRNCLCGSKAIWVSNTLSHFVCFLEINKENKANDQHPYHNDGLGEVIGTV